MEENFVTFELARKLKEKGYPQNNCFRCYFVGDEKVRGCSVGDVTHRSHKGEKHLIAAPTISQVLKWLREEKKIHIVIDFFLFNDNTKILWVFIVRDIQNDSTYEIFEDCRRNTFNEAALAGIEYVLDNLI